MAKSSFTTASVAGKNLDRLLMPQLLTALCLVAIGINLRPALSSVASILTDVQQDLRMSAAAAGMLMTLPVLCFGLFAHPAARLAVRLTTNRVILHGLLVLVAGLMLRIFFGETGLFLGTLLAGAGIGAVMVLVPSVIKRDFPRQAGFMTGLYTMAVCLGASLAAGATVPLHDHAGGSWRLALAAWALPAALSAWAWHYRMRREPAGEKAQQWKVSGIYLDPLAWQVTLYMGLQSAIAFIIFAWLPAILIERGMDPATCGYMMSLIFACQVFTALTAPSLGSRGRDQRFISCFFFLITIIGVLACLHGPLASIWLWGAVVGLGMGGTFSIAMAMIVWRSPSPAAAAALSGMVQGVGYMIAALGPLAVGIVRERAHGWSFLWWLLLLIAIPGFVSAIGAGRKLHIGATVAKA
jgi:CP family cyanate transporter-like MFS transporter